MQCSIPATEHLRRLRCTVVILRGDRTVACPPTIWFFVRDRPSDDAGNPGGDPHAAGAACACRGTGPGGWRFRDRHRRIRQHGLVAECRHGPERFDPHGRLHHQLLCVGRGRRRAAAGRAGCPDVAARPGPGADGVLRAGQPRQHAGADAPLAGAAALPQRPAARRLFRHRFADRGFHGRPEWTRTGGRPGDDGPDGRHTAGHALGHLGRANPRLAFLVRHRSDHRRLGGCPDCHVCPGRRTGCQGQRAARTRRPAQGATVADAGGRRGRLRRHVRCVQLYHPYPGGRRRPVAANRAVRADGVRGRHDPGHDGRRPPRRPTL